MARKRALGKGLGTLLQSARVAEEIEQLQRPATVELEVARDRMLREIPVEFIERGRYQPRRDMNPEALEELASSIRKQGVMQPIVVRPVGDGSEDRFEIIAGERRWRATQLAGLDKIPAVIREVPDEAAIAMALIENIQREDLNPIEEAIALSRLKEEFELTQQEVAEAVGKSRVTVTNLLRLLNLREDVRKMLEYGDIEAGHAKALLGLPDAQQLEAARTVVGKALSVRQTEALVRRMQQEAEAATSKVKKAIDPDIRSLEEDLSQKIGAKVAIQHTAKGKGKLVISYNTLDELDGVLAHIQ
ncbi:ParB/RepB/Spo0J family partition protein [Parendozoicomonas haliclonae]|uniref:Probable chromosome-partitioning protein ParB n=1 Tax=Parendozoicomonas haliclonae TaxID=1960125 RepID=A0A1X7AJF0_9GAMM|nr:ParB/RepB/Spo0J family partition protein [Parendozoicomonas haliclonae]SMA46546.1 putative chromosome-partitioning protein ParB [Parendozoicomonas haliclonae]